VVDDAVAALDRGDVVVLPTETVYGLAARVDRPEAIEKIFELKGRSAEKVLQVLVPDATWLERVGDPSGAARRLADEFWPGPLTLVVRAKPDTPAVVMKDGAVGVRVPDNATTRSILARIGPVAASSANIAGEPTPDNIDAIRELFGDGVAVYIDGGTIRGSGSTVVDVSSGEMKLIREGPLTFDRVKSVAGESI
jgi:tRNA threonylcarbamoyl adenosine modification protein (Sua5/YciO/YrdC/YwlC family)